MKLSEIEAFLNRNPCLSQEWKDELLQLISSTFEIKNVYPGVKTRPNDPGSPTTERYMDFIEPHEGRRNEVYTDTMGHPTIGVGFNLDRPGAEWKIKSYGIDYTKIVSGEDFLPDAVIDDIFREDVELTVQQTKSLVNPAVFAGLPYDMKLVLVDMCFNLGRGGLGKFKKFLAAVERKDYNRAADEMVDSKWYGQVGNRSKKLEEMVRKLGENVNL